MDYILALPVFKSVRSSVILFSCMRFLIGCECAFQMSVKRAASHMFQDVLDVDLPVS